LAADVRARFRDFSPLKAFNFALTTGAVHRRLRR
jgi:hypothetical protein